MAIARSTASGELLRTHGYTTSSSPRHSYPPAEARPLPTSSHTWDPVYRPSPRALRSQGDDATAGMFEPGDKRVVDTKLGFFKRADDGRDAGKESGRGKGRAGVGAAIARDEL